MRSPGGKGEETPPTPYSIQKEVAMVNKIINIIVLLLFVVWLFIFTWPTDATGIISTITLIVFAFAAGISISNLLGGVKRGK